MKHHSAREWTAEGAASSVVAKAMPTATRLVPELAFANPGLVLAM